MARTITFNELRELKDKLPDGSIHQIATELDMKPETVRNYFRYNYKEGKSVGIHIEPGPNGGIVVLDDKITIFDKALKNNWV